MSRKFIIYCRECGSRAIISKTIREHNDFYAVHCRCKNPECGHGWVANFEYAHTTKASKSTINGLLDNLIQRLPKIELENIMKSLSKQLQSS